MHQRQDGVTDDLGLVPQQFEIKRVGVALGGDLLGGSGRDNATAGLRHGERDLYFNILADELAIVKYRPHLRCAERVAKKDGVEDTG